MAFIQLTLSEAKERLASLGNDDQVIQGILSEHLYTYDLNLSAAPNECYEVLGVLSERCHPALKALQQELAKERVALKRAIRNWEEQMANTRIEIDLDDTESGVEGRNEPPGG